METRTSKKALDTIHDIREFFCALGEDQAIELLTSVLTQLQDRIDELEKTTAKEKTILHEHLIGLPYLPICSICGFTINSANEVVVRKNQGHDIIAHSSCICDNLEDN